MDKKVIKNFAVNARNKLMEDIKYQLNSIGIGKSKISPPSQRNSDREIYDVEGFNPKILYKKEIIQRTNLIQAINEKGYENLVEEVAYTWFNRIIAIRFMEINNYLPTKVRVLSSETKNRLEPPIVTEAPNIDLNFDESEIAKIYSLKNQNNLDELFQFLFIKQCNELNNILPVLFEKTEDYFELLLSISFTKEDGIIRDLINSISEDYFEGQVEIIGWLHQYYNSELKYDTVAQVKKSVKITKEKIPLVTQLFTPDWVVKYMVENSLGKLWLENHKDDSLKENWKYYIDEVVNEKLSEEDIPSKSNDLNKVSKNLKLEDIKIIDPCMGSGHILVYVFDFLMEIYLSQGYNKKDATISILKNNIYGLDIDDRAYQLAYFALMMKARSYYQQIFKKKIELNLLSIQESKHLTEEIIDYLANNNNNNNNYNSGLKENLEYIKDVFADAKNFGSLISVKSLDFKRIIDSLFLNENNENLLSLNENNNNSLSLNENNNNLLSLNEINNILLPLINQGKLLSQKYDVLVTNPPYMGTRGMNNKLSDFLKANYKDNKTDLFSAFIERSFSFCKDDSYCGFLTPYVWMFIKSYEKLRKEIIENKTLTSLIQFEYGAFKEAIVPICTFTFKNSKENVLGNYIKLSDFKGGMDVQKAKTLEAIKDSECDYFYNFNQNEFLEIPGNPIAFWIERELINAFKKGKRLSSIADVHEGVKTANNDYFIRNWYEVEIDKTNIQQTNDGNKWFKHTKGGIYRKWYGNNESLLNYENNGYELKNFEKSSITAEDNFFCENISWTRITSSKTGFRYTPEGFIPNMAGLSLYPKKDFYYILAYLNSKIVENIVEIINPTLNFPPGVISKIPIIFSEDINEKVVKIAKENIFLEKEDYDNFEISWDFTQHIFIKFKKDENLIEEVYNKWENISEYNFNHLKENEEEINSLFISLHDLDKKMSPKLIDKDITISKADLESDVKSFLSYFVGCLFGRYSLDVDGIAYAGGEFNKLNYDSFIPVEDNIVPIFDNEYFGDDIINKLIEFLKITFSEETLQENIKFIANALGNKGKTHRETIRKYFLNDFYKDHVKIYKKTPIYWMFNSGKENGFNALIYIHRYTPDVLTKIRILYLHKVQKLLQSSIINNGEIIKNSSNKNDKNQLNKENIKLKKQLEEIARYDEILEYIAKKKIDLDLDDGVKHNYAKFQGIVVGNRKIDLLKKL